MPEFRQRMIDLYPCENVDYSGCFDNDDVCHLTGGFRSRPRVERVLSGLRAVAGATPSVGTLIEKMENAGSIILPRFFAGVGTDCYTDDGNDDVNSAASGSALNLFLAFKKRDSENRRFRWWRRNEPEGEFEIRAELSSLIPALELRSLHGARGFGAEWVPASCVYETTELNGATVKNIELEAPGVLFEDVEVQTTKAGIKVSMKKRIPYHDSFRTKIDEDGRAYGLFVRDFSFHDKDAIFQPMPPPEGLSMKDGVLSLRLYKVEMTKTVKKRVVPSNFDTISLAPSLSPTREPSDSRSDFRSTFSRQ